jgi:site-specific DNA recombinase
LADNELQHERELITLRREEWRIAQERLDDIEAWPYNGAANVRDLTYDQRRLALEALGVKVEGWKEDHNPRWTMETKLNILSQSSCLLSKFRI